MSKGISKTGLISGPELGLVLGLLSVGVTLGLDVGEKLGWGAG